MNCKYSYILLFYFFHAVFSRELKDMSLNDLVRLAEDISQIRPNDVNPSDVTFFLATRENPILQEINGKSTLLDTQKPAKFLIHGWIENHTNRWYQLMTKEYLKKGDFNIIQVDWERGARSAYISSAPNCRLVGKLIANFILEQNYPLDLVHLVGHSLGSHVAGFAGKALIDITETKVARITALDPAGPYFNRLLITENERLSKNDAETVVAIHTDGGFYGYDGIIGTLDVFMNGGTRIQPGCLEKNLKSEGLADFVQNSFCSHQRSCYYFIESINGDKFNCRKCNLSLEDYVNQFCSNAHEFQFNGEDDLSRQSGLCLVETNSKPPFLRN